MNISRNGSYSNLVLSKNEEHTFETLLEPIRMTLCLALVAFGGGTAKILMTLNGFIPGERTVNLWDGVGVGIGSVVGFLALVGLIFVKPLALRLMVRSRLNHWFSI